MYIFLILYEIPEKIQIDLLRCLVVLVFTEYAVPFVDYHYERMPLRSIYILDRIHHIRIVKIVHTRIQAFEISDHQPADTVYKSIYVFASAQELLHIEKDHIVPVQMFFKALIRGYLESRKHLTAVASPPVIRRQHACSQ